MCAVQTSKVAELDGRLPVQCTPLILIPPTFEKDPIDSSDCADIRRIDVFLLLDLRTSDALRLIHRERF